MGFPLSEGTSEDAGGRWGPRRHRENPLYSGVGFLARVALRGQK